MSNTPNPPQDLLADGNGHEQSFFSDRPSAETTGSGAPSDTNVASFETEKERAEMNGSSCDRSTKGGGGDSSCRDSAASSGSSNGSAPLALPGDEDLFELLNSDNFMPDSLFLSGQYGEQIQLSDCWELLVKDIRKQCDVFWSEGKSNGRIHTSTKHFGFHIAVLLKRSQGRSSLCFKLDFDRNGTLLALHMLGLTEKYNEFHDQAFCHRLGEAGKIPESAKEALERIPRVPIRDTFSTSRTGYCGWLLQHLTPRPGDVQKRRSYWYYGVIDSRPAPTDQPVATC